MDEETFQVSVRPEPSVTAVRTMPNTEPANGLFIYAPGAGSNINDPFGSYLSQRLVQAGFAFVRFQFPYMEAGKRRPDQTSLLEETWKQVIETVKIADAKVIIGGRSMGGRIASHVAAQGAAVDAVALFAYPLYPPGNPNQVAGQSPAANRGSGAVLLRHQGHLRHARRVGGGRCHGSQGNGPPVGGSRSRIRRAKIQRPDSGGCLERGHRVLAVLARDRSS